ncbi:MAG: peptidyl-prolyl cis-trans isomerase [Acidobacteria bacterium]|nr:peptidyl-prolyl cis-trans isomerase [Acidobacteriota bacterium]
MLKFFRKMERTRNFVILLFGFILVLSLVLFYSPSGGVQENLTRSDEVAAQVGGERITVGDVAMLQERLKQSQPQILPTSYLLDSMIQEKIIRVEAARLGLTATDAEIATQIREAFQSPDGKPFDQKQYEQNAVQQAGSISAYEEGIRDQISRQKLVAYITSGVRVSEEEILNDYKRRNTKFNLTYVPVNTADLTENITPTDEELKDYFEKNKKSYYISSPQKKIKYVFLETAKIGETLKFTDEELKAAYDKLPEDKKLAGVRVQEIVLRVNKPEDDAQVLQKANEIVETLKKSGDTITEEKFGEIAKGQSEKPSTAFNGGKVDGLVRENPNNPTDPYQRILSMKEGETTEPLKFGSNYYILRRGESVAKPFESAKKEIEVSRRNSKAYEANAALATKAAESLKKSKDVEKVAAEFASQANMNTADMIRETGYVKPGDEIDKLGISQDFEQGIATLNKVNDVGDKIPIPGGFAIPILVDKKDPREANFDEVRSQVVEAVKTKKAREEVDKIAKKIADSASTAGDLSAAAKAEGLESQEAKEFILGSPLGSGPSATTSEALEDAVFALKPGEVTKQPVKVGDNWFVVGVNSREEANMESFPKEREQLVRTKLNEKRSRVFGDYIASRKLAMEQNGEIKIYKDAIAKLDKANQENQPQIPNLPQGIQIPQQQPPNSGE